MDQVERESKEYEEFVRGQLGHIRDLHRSYNHAVTFKNMLDHMLSLLGASQAPIVLESSVAEEEGKLE